MNVLGLDIGDRRIGIALADSTSPLAVPLVTLTNNRSFLNELVKLKHQHNFSKIIIGLPYTFAGREGSQAHKVKELAEKIRAKLLVEIIFQDERLTTKLASEKLRILPSATSDVDSVSAQLILQSWLDSRAS
jgi:putative holliday junction resolvase